MLALAEKSRVYPVLLPQRTDAAPRHLSGTRRRTRSSPTARAVAVVLLMVLPAVFYVYGRAQIARTGYLILQLQRDVSTLQAERDRLAATVAALKTPERIEHIATAQLGMVPPRPQQLAALTVAPDALAAVEPPRRSTWDQLRSWLGGEAEAHEAH